MAFLILLTAWALGARAQVPETPADADADAALFLGGLVSAPLDFISEDTRFFGFGAASVDGEFGLGFAYLGLSQKLSDHVTLAGGYFGLYVDETPSRPEPRDNRIRGDLTFATIWRGWGLQHRQRFEYRFRDLEDGFRYRPSLTVNRPFSIAGRKLVPEVTWEPFYDFAEDRLTIHFVQTGLRIPLSRQVSLEPAYWRVITTADAAQDLNFFLLLARASF